MIVASLMTLTSCKGPEGAGTEASPPASAQTSVPGSGQPVPVSADTSVDTAPATPASDVEYYASAALAHIADSLARTPRTGHVMSSHPTFQTIELRRAASGVPEVHDRWTDVMLFQSGRASLLLGGRVNGGSLTAPGERRGGTIVGGNPRPVVAGDMLVIPAGTPHQVQIARGDSLRYITIKVPAATR